MLKGERQFREAIKTVGLKLIEMRHNKHFRAVVERGDGKRATFFFSATPSDVRAIHNKQAMLRRFASGKEI